MMGSLDPGPTGFGLAGCPQQPIPSNTLSRCIRFRRVSSYTRFFVAIMRSKPHRRSRRQIMLVSARK